jgi:hypothetical protein
MPLPRYAAKRDISEPEIVRALEQCGFSVERMDTPVDLLVSFRQHCWLVECKTGKGKLNANQKAFLDRWKGPPVVVLRDAQEAIDFAVEMAQRIQACPSNWRVDR